MAEAAIGFMPPDEGLALHEAGLLAGELVPDAPLVEIGSWCGKSSVYLGAAARERGTVLFAVDHHRGSEENQPGCGGRSDGGRHGHSLRRHDPDQVRRVGCSCTPLSRGQRLPGGRRVR